MNLQYILDNKGETTGVFIPIQEWLSFKKKFKNADLDTSELPQSHMDELDRRVALIESGQAELFDIDEAFEDIEKDLQ